MRFSLNVVVEVGIDNTTEADTAVNILQRRRSEQAIIVNNFSLCYILSMLHCVASVQPPTCVSAAFKQETKKSEANRAIVRKTIGNKKTLYNFASIVSM